MISKIRSYKFKINNYNFRFRKYNLKIRSYNFKIRSIIRKFQISEERRGGEQTAEEISQLHPESAI